MSAISLQGNASGTGTLTIAAPNTNTNRTLTLPDGTGTFSVAGVNSNIVSGTAVASTSGTSIDFTSIPSWVKRITVMLNGVSTNGTASPLIQIGDSGGVVTSGYISTSAAAIDGLVCSAASSTAGFLIRSFAAANINSGHMVLTNISGNIWISSHTIKISTTSCSMGGGDKTLSGTLDRVRITTVTGTDTFDAGSINILYE